MNVSAISGYLSTIGLVNALSPASAVTSAEGLSSLLALGGGDSVISDLGRLLGAVEDLSTAAGTLAAPGAWSDATGTSGPVSGPALAVSGFVAAYNEVQGNLATLGRDSLSLGGSVALLRTQLAAALGSGLAPAGITADSDGTLVFDIGKFQSALAADPAAVAGLFRNGGRGAAEQVASLTEGALSPTRLLQIASPALSAPDLLAQVQQANLVDTLLGQGATTADFSSTVNLSDQFLLAQLASASQQGGSLNSNIVLDLLLSQSAGLSQNLGGLRSRLDLIGLL